MSNFTTTLNDVRVRIAPSPTGNLHIGTARTALFNYMFARRHSGTFILRIEDTDTERSTQEYANNIFEGLTKLGLDWDEGPSLEGDKGGEYGPYRQSERVDLYQKYIQKLLDEGKAYHCYLSEDELNAERAEAKANNEPYIYSGKCRDPKVREELAKDPSRKPVIRFRVPDDRGTIVVSDLIRGDIAFESDLLSDFVIVKSDGMPTYTLCNVIDDSLMKISHVIRGEDLLPNTPNQLLIYEGLDIDPPKFAHLSLILAPDRTKLSKRHGATSLAEFVDQGYLPEAICNFLTLLGWSSPTADEEGTLEFFSSQFDIERCSHSATVFDIDRLNSINAKMIRAMDLDTLLKVSKPHLADFSLDQYDDEKLKLILDAVREPITMLSELPEQVKYFFGRKVIHDAQLVGEVLTGPEQETVLNRFRDEFLETADFSSIESVGEAMTEFVAATKPIKTKVVMWTIRGSVTGQTRGADLNTTLYILGKDIIKERVNTALELTTNEPSV